MFYTDLLLPSMCVVSWERPAIPGGPRLLGAVAGTGVQVADAGVRVILQQVSGISIFQSSAMLTSRSNDTHNCLDCLVGGRGGVGVAELLLCKDGATVVVLRRIPALGCKPPRQAPLLSTQHCNTNFQNQDWSIEWACRLRCSAASLFD